MGHKPAFDRLEDRCLLTIYTTPPAFTPVAEMVFGPAGDLWFNRVNDLAITRIAANGTLEEFGLPPDLSQPASLEVDAADNLWLTNAASPPDNALLRLTPEGTVTIFNDFSSVLQRIDDQPVPPTAFLTHGHLNADNSALLVGLNADSTVSFFSLPTGVPVGEGLYWSRPLSIAVHPFGTIWYTDNDAIGRLTRSGEFTRFPLPDGNNRAEGIALNGDGSLWFVENRVHVSPTLDSYYLADKLGRITLDGVFTEFDVKLAGFRLKLGNLVPATDGGIWFEQQGVEEDGVTPEPNTHRISHIAPDGTITRFIASGGVISIVPQDTFAAGAVSASGDVARSPTFFTEPFSTQASFVEVYALQELTAVDPVNYAPVTVDDSVTAFRNTPLTIARPGVLGNDTDANSDALRAILVSGPSHGTLTLNLNGSYTYVPDTDYEGTDSFTYKASDGLLEGNTATVTITVLGGSPLEAPNEGKGSGTDTPTPQPGSPSKPADSSAAGKLTLTELQPLIQAAFVRWAAVVPSAAVANTLHAVRVEVVDLPGTLLGLTQGTTIWIDRNAAGHGWFVDLTPTDDEEFTSSAPSSDFHAKPSSPAATRVDLVTVLTHEMGHALGLDHDKEGVMEATLGPGVRRRIGDEERQQLTPTVNALLDPGLPAPVISTRSDGNELLAPAELFPRFPHAAGAGRLTGSLAYPIELLRDPGTALPQVAPSAGPRTAGTGGAVLVGGDGEDVVIGERGRDLLVGGIGASRASHLVPEMTSAGPNLHQVKERVLRDLLADWSAERDDLGRLLAP